MLELFAVMYMYCTLSTTNPEGLDAKTIQNIPQGIVFKIDQTVQTPSTPPPAPEPPQPVEVDNTPLDYVSELKKLGYYREESKDGKLNLRNAVVRFQSDRNLDISGNWDEQSLSALKKQIKDANFSFSDVVSSYASDGKWIIINKSKRILTLYQNKNVLKKYPIAVGNPQTLTPSGKYQVLNKIKNPAWGGGGYAKPVPGGSSYNPLGYRWMGLSITKGGDRYGVHGNSSPYSIGTFASHGCIRMINSDVESLFEIVPVHTNVWIGEDKEIQNWGVNQKRYIE